MRGKVFDTEPNPIYSRAVRVRSFKLGLEADYLPDEPGKLDPEAYNSGLRVHKMGEMLEEHRRTLYLYLKFLVVYDPKNAERNLKEASKLVEELKEIRDEEERGKSLENYFNSSISRAERMIRDFSVIHEENNRARKRRLASA